jgi:hypothetical protein
MAARDGVGRDGGSLRAGPRRPGRADAGGAWKRRRPRAATSAGRQSAALVVTDAAADRAARGTPGASTLRVDDHAEPLVELRRHAQRCAAPSTRGISAEAVAAWGRQVDEQRTRRQRWLRFRAGARVDAGEPGGRLLVCVRAGQRRPGGRRRCPTSSSVYTPCSPSGGNLAPRMAAAGLLPEDAGLLARITAG